MRTYGIKLKISSHQFSNFAATFSRNLASKSIFSHNKILSFPKLNDNVIIRVNLCIRKIRRGPIPFLKFVWRYSKLLSIVSIYTQNGIFWKYTLYINRKPIALSAYTSEIHFSTYCRVGSAFCNAVPEDDLPVTRFLKEEG